MMLRDINYERMLEKTSDKLPLVDEVNVREREIRRNYKKKYRALPLDCLGDVTSTCHILANESNIT